MNKLCISISAVLILFIGEVKAQAMGPGLSVTDCPNTRTRHGYHIYPPDTDAKAVACAQITPPPPCDCELGDQPHADLMLFSPARMAGRIWADYIGTKSCGFMQTRNSELNKQKFQSILQDEAALGWSWPILLKQYLGLYSSINGDLKKLPKWCEIQKEISENENLKRLMKIYLETDSADVPLSERIKMYGIYAHLFGEDAAIKALLKTALTNLLKNPANANLAEKQKVIWYGYYHLDMKIGDYAKLATPPLGSNHRTPLNESSVQALRILNNLNLESDAKVALKWVWYQTGDRQMMSQDGLIDFVNTLGSTDERLYPSINDFLTRLENGQSKDYAKVSSLLVIIGIKDFSTDQWAQILNRSYKIADKMEDKTKAISSNKRARKFIIEAAVSNKVPYDKILAMVDMEIKVPEKSPDKFIDRANQLYQITGLTEAGKDKISNQFVKEHFYRTLKGEYGEKFTSKKERDRKDGFDFLRDKNLSADGMRYALSIYFNTDLFKEVTASAVQKSKAQISYSEARPGEYPTILKLIRDSKLSAEEKTRAEELMN